MKTSITRTQWVLIITLTLAAAPYFVRLGASSLWDANEAFYAETPREMIESQDYINPTFNYRPRLNKPPLCYWIVVPFYKALGVSEAAERLPIALAAMILIATAYGLGRALFSQEAGLLAAICLAVAPRFLMFSRRIMIDVYLAMFMALALLMFVIAERRPERRRLCLMLMYVCIGLGVLTKGPVAAALPAAALVIYLIFRGRLDRLREMMLPAGLIVIAALVLPWYIAIYYQHGWSHIEAFILKDNLSRYTQQVWGPKRGFFFYIPVMIGDLFPWSVFLIPLLWLALRKLWNKKHRGNPALSHQSEMRSHNNESALLAIWITVIVVFFSLSRSKEDLYILPIYPAAAALIGGLIAGLTGNRPANGQSHLRWTVLTLAMVIASAGAAVLFLFGAGKQPYELAGAELVGCAAIIGGLVATGAALASRTLTAILATALTLTVCNWLFVLRVLPDFERYKPVLPLCELIAGEARTDALVGYYKSAYPSMVFYLRRPVFEYYEPREIEAAFSSGKQVFCVMTASEYEAIRTRLPAETRVLASRPIFQVKLKGVLDRVELPQVVLISNKEGIEAGR